MSKQWKDFTFEAEHKKTVINDSTVKKFHVWRVTGQKEGCLSIKDCLLSDAENLDCKPLLVDASLSREALRDFLNDPETARIMGF